MRALPELIYGLDDRPPWPRSLLYGIQWAVVFIPTLTILSSISSEHLGLAGQDKVIFFQRLLLVTGAVMILQTLWGHRYPLLDGPSSALLLSFIILAPEGLPLIQGGMMAGGLGLVLASWLGLIRRLEMLFTENVIGVILILVAITILPFLGPMVIGQNAGQPQGDPLVSGISLLVILIIAVCSHWLPGFPRTVSLLLGVIFGTLLMGILGRVDGAGVHASFWVSLPSPLFAGPPRFSVSGVLTFLVTYVAVLVNGVGSTYSIGEVVGKDGMAGRVNRGIAVTGIGGLASGLFGVIGTVSYALSPGVVLVTRVGSCFPLTVCGMLLVSLAFLQKPMAALGAIPPCVVGAALLTGMAAQIGAGISVLTRAGRSLNGRDYLVVGIPVLLAGIVSIAPATFFDAFPAEIRALLKNGLVVGILCVLLLEHALLPKREQGV